MGLNLDLLICPIILVQFYSKKSPIIYSVDYLLAVQLDEDYSTKEKIKNTKNDRKGEKKKTKNKKEKKKRIF